MVLLLAILLTAALIGFQRFVIRRTGSIAIRADSLHYRSDLLMNLAVIAALLLTEATGWPMRRSAVRPRRRARAPVQRLRGRPPARSTC